jgi:ketosteroid isomerase-like protein
MFMNQDFAAQSEKTAEIMRRFNDAFQKHDPSALPDLVAENCIIENTVPAPDGARHTGRDAFVKLWQGIASDRSGRFDVEDVIAAGERATIRWRYWRSDGSSIRGVNLMRVRDGLIVEAMGYVKGA